ncbi:4-hydroxythreonine-4-phosphate dehydrogenase [Candidatus Kinetoplastibacterium desouzaii TCC079E]|uniref:4-hydroxythreonine-4-phosphate dehydrogenase n=1 Tax=Candidatus Kinetoplastidibacterium desouzai TCC079E TaxID=1208919 RepID=M1L2E8_9PROT|nr:4-hydroxythreonine-4-phosphate dehydrogenase PdxA [Candidatus Kinetoplastibacterium desouzaii]AGF46923.1 4-hydroxythreonine-4-phosphate dehydrogenase [Candidatus Kinetoplastibacterium desouzaii TCC079E]
MKLPIIGITMGDPFGVGPEIIIKSFLNGFSTPTVIYGDIYILNKAAELINKKIDIVSIQSSDLKTNNDLFISNRKLYVIESYRINQKQFTPSKTSSIGGFASYQYIINAVQDALSNKINAIVTAPINKESFSKAGINFPGHTELLANLTNTSDFGMMMLNDSLKIILVTIHLPLSKVSEFINIKNELKYIKMANDVCVNLGIRNPIIGVAGLNPHAGENGKFGNEEIDSIIPAINEARDNGINVSGPWPGDTIFMKARNGDFDIVVAQYHDQGLIPIKYLGIDNGVNVTIGLPIIRTSVDHGTAFDIAWKNGIADNQSLLSAISVAIDLSKKQKS